MMNEHHSTDYTGLDWTQLSETASYSD